MVDATPSNQPPPAESLRVEPAASGEFEIRVKPSAPRVDQDAEMWVRLLLYSGLLTAVAVFATTAIIPVILVLAATGAVIALGARGMLLGSHRVLAIPIGFIAANAAAVALAAALRVPGMPIPLSVIFAILWISLAIYLGLRQGTLSAVAVTAVGGVMIWLQYQEFVKLPANDALPPFLMPRHAVAAGIVLSAGAIATTWFAILLLGFTAPDSRLWNFERERPREPPRSRLAPGNATPESPRSFVLMMLTYLPLAGLALGAAYFPPLLLPVGATVFFALIFHAARERRYQPLAVPCALLATHTSIFFVAAIAVHASPLLMIDVAIYACLAFLLTVHPSYASVWVVLLIEIGRSGFCLWEAEHVERLRIPGVPPQAMLNGIWLHMCLQGATVLSLIGAALEVRVLDDWDGGGADASGQSPVTPPKSHSTEALMAEVVTPKPGRMDERPRG
jgi:hypothetical protein